MKITITPEAIEATRQKCQCVKSIDADYRLNRDDPKFESCIEYWDVCDYGEWCEGCVNAVKIIVKLNK